MYNAFKSFRLLFETYQVQTLAVLPATMAESFIRFFLCRFFQTRVV